MGRKIEETLQRVQNRDDNVVLDLLIRMILTLMVLWLVVLSP